MGGKGMKQGEKRMILILIAITIIVYIISVIVKNNNGKLKEQEQVKNQGTELIQMREDGTKTNISEKLKESKILDNLEVSDIQIIEKNGEANITANITNTSSMLVKEFPITIKVVNKLGETIQEVGAYVGKMKAGETRSINASIYMDISEIYDCSIIKK